jgi:hypothetical protein
MLEVPLNRKIRRAVSEESLASLASAAFIFEESQSGSTGFRTESSDAWWNVREFPAAHHMRRHVEIAGSAGPSKREYSTGTTLPEWPAVNDAVVASGKLHLLTFDLDPTTLPSDVLCHLAIHMFVSAGLPEGLAEDRVRRFILAVRASMPDNPYHNFFHVFDVMQTTNAFATSTGTLARLDSWERFALLSAALW